MATGVLADEIRHKLGELSPAERKVGRVLLAAYPSAGFETVAAIAERAQVSAPTVLRFVSRFGFRGFPDFQAALRAELQERNASPLSLYDAPAYGRPVEEGTDQGSLLDRVGRIFPSEVAKTLAELPPHDLDQAVRLLADARLRVTLAGGRFTHLLAHYLGLHLMQLREGVRFLPDRSVERTAALASLGRRDLLVLFDYRRYEADKVAMAEHSRARGGKVLLFTDTWLSPVAGPADVTLPCRVTAPSPYDSLVPTLAVIETVVAGVVEALGEAAHDHLRRAEDIAQHIGLV
ncbi:MurR/RpiR family transcriptional regulator [Streptomyces sp. ME19-01-6]|uniref:MurR/RpiR family transcriptional regulator n=1 Tax=Streptomyces sp. ME19-01-6 TaxID=3028686 RepID=UPI0029A80AB8|nr:MurR/RpiR family transcriptional regulator [Streptomyces sp. ME19-01-6]MDX3231408.1 MurR/RpiR family transcriptional regulator [Streptomyces sp. ME19-01-6]